MESSTSVRASCKDSFANFASIGFVVASAGFGAVFAWQTGSTYGVLLGSLAVIMALSLEVAKPLAVVGMIEAGRKWEFGRAVLLAVLASIAILYSLTAELQLVASSRAAWQDVQGTHKPWSTRAAPATKRAATWKHWDRPDRLQSLLRSWHRHGSWRATAAGSRRQRSVTPARACLNSKARPHAPRAIPRQPPGLGRQRRPWGRPDQSSKPTPAQRPWQASSRRWARTFRRTGWATGWCWWVCWRWRSAAHWPGCSRALCSTWLLPPLQCRSFRPFPPLHSPLCSRSRTMPALVCSPSSPQRAALCSLANGLLRNVLVCRLRVCAKYSMVSRRMVWSRYERELQGRRCN